MVDESQLLTRADRAQYPDKDIDTTIVISFGHDVFKHKFDKLKVEVDAGKFDVPRSMRTITEFCGGPEILSVMGD